MRSIIKYIDEALFSSASEFSKADNDDIFNKIDDLEFVDLGLSVDWATCNLGAEKETDAGNYYMWGSTEPNDNDNCCWENAPFNNGNEEFDEDYFNSVKNKVCPKGILAPEYDAVYQESDGEYRMPTKEEIVELINNTNHELIEKYKGTKVNGMKFTNKHDNSKFIFIPAAGYRSGSSTTSISPNAGLWSASLNAYSESLAWRLSFDIFDVNNVRAYGYNSNYGFPIRPVKDN